ncbi:hypothetical protein COEREDRAFT_11820 [Coemansia reversa NRRL 1564]|uniref:Uncharacterized protein n=1 Tax=Coemansia reversa (strain ATCC 12441 / NRRL 1564) TaxID=763665 RepID=A0A2G5B223_COERN|nr:hypothetical protein COEREDRAFT_11820 [Coemansia reversa NRRL 1564]|eukprot:PIA13055.1 hypothetical protein COEREDRAFT_11820 [Coemansia reversa NRRL 1564]
MKGAKVSLRRSSKSFNTTPILFALYEKVATGCFGSSSATFGERLSAFSTCAEMAGTTLRVVTGKCKKTSGLRRAGYSSSSATAAGCSLRGWGAAAEVRPGRRTTTSEYKGLLGAAEAVAVATGAVAVTTAVAATAAGPAGAAGTTVDGDDGTAGTGGAAGAREPCGADDEAEFAMAILFFIFLFQKMAK